MIGKEVNETTQAAAEKTVRPSSVIENTRALGSLNNFRGVARNSYLIHQ
jgi:hypothetical protein